MKYEVYFREPGRVCNCGGFILIGNYAEADAIWEANRLLHCGHDLKITVSRIEDGNKVEIPMKDWFDEKWNIPKGSDDKWFKPKELEVL